MALQGVAVKILFLICYIYFNTVVPSAANSVLHVYIM